MTRHLSFLTVTIALAGFAAFLWGAESDAKTYGAWQNPDVGFVLDMITDVSDVEEMYGKATTQGLTIRTAELCVSANVDPFGFLVGNFNFSEHGAGLHEGYFILPALPFNLRLKGGHMLANFGRWTQFHTHAMPFVSEPRIYLEYMGGHLAANGVELSWLLPIPFYVELTGSVYDKIRGHTHDGDPVKSGYESEADRLAAESGYVKHGNHYHAPDGSIVLAEELVDPDEPATDIANLSPGNLAYAGRITTNLELGLNWSVDIGTSIIHQAVYKTSRRIDGHAYPKTAYGADITFFWHPLTQALYRNLDFGIEFLGNYEGFERVTQENRVYEDLCSRKGIFSHIRYTHSPTWHYGLFGERFEPIKGEIVTKQRYGAFITYHISHFQYLRLEANRYEFSGYLDPVHRLQLQYDATIGYHTHGRQR